MKTTIIVIIVIGIIFILISKSSYWTNKELKIQANESYAPIEMFSIHSGNQNELIFYIDYDQKWFNTIANKYTWDNFDQYDNRFFEYMYVLHDELPKQSNSIGNSAFMDKLTKGQKVFYSMLVFSGQVDNGGVYQFFFNNPEFSFAVLESLKELKLEKLHKDYENCLIELLGSVDQFNNRRNAFQDNKEVWKKRWKTFADGYSELPSAKVIEDYFYDEKFKKEFYKTVVNYIDNNLDQFVKK